MEKNYDSKKVSEKEISSETSNKNSIIVALKRLIGNEKENDIHGLSQFAWP